MADDADKTGGATGKAGAAKTSTRAARGRTTKSATAKTSAKPKPKAAAKPKTVRTRAADAGKRAKTVVSGKGGMIAGAAAAIGVAAAGVAAAVIAGRKRKDATAAKSATPAGDTGYKSAD